MTDPKTAGIQRYDCGGPVVPATRGPFVRHEDHLRVVAGLTEVMIDGCTGREWMEMCGRAELEQDRLRQDCERLAVRVKKQADEIAALRSDPKAEQARASVAALTRTVLEVKGERDAAVARAEKAEESLALCENLARRLAQGARAVTADDFLAVLRGES